MLFYHVNNSDHSTTQGLPSRRSTLRHLPAFGRLSPDVNPGCEAPIAHPARQLAKVRLLSLLDYVL